MTQELAARYLGITPRSFRQIHKTYRSTGKIPAIGVNLGRPKKEVPEEWKEIIKQEYENLQKNRRASKNEGSPGYDMKGNILYQQFISIGMKVRSSKESSCVPFWMVNFMT